MFEGLFQPLHLLIVFAVVLLVFGPKKLPELGKGIGEAIRGFKQGVNEKDHEQPTESTAKRSEEKG
ncbi:MAG TPA: twin-arginine translocase TatA/TatE family subunit [Blastocatellia bacterium]|jgi:sec-independent protein translocase protein TatA|nr:twin-arginine translocase TatA/TatE family subunit [Blastocatellia bacterium]